MAAPRTSARLVARYVALTALFAALHFASEWIALSSAAVAGNAAPVWIASAVALTIVYFAGYRYLPAVAIGALAGNLLTGVPLVAVLGATIGAVAEAAAGTFLLRRFDFRPALNRLRDTAALILVASVAAAAASATFGVTGLWASGGLNGHSYGSVWILWWFANTTSILIAAPIMLMAVDRARRRPWPAISPANAAVFALYLGTLAIVSALVFLVPEVPEVFIFPFIVFPFALLIAIRYGPPGAVAANVVLAAFALTGTFQEAGPFGYHQPFAETTLAGSLLVAQVFVVTVGITTLALAAAVAERARTQEKLRDAEKRHRILVERIPAVTYVDAVEDAQRGTITTLYVSPQIEAMLGHHPSEFTDDPGLWARILHPEDRDAALAKDREHYRSGEPLTDIYRMVRADGRIVWIRDEAAVMTDYAGHPLVVQGVLLDITELMEAQAERDRFRARLVEAQEEERSRIAVDIHDDPLQKMTAVGLRLETVRRRLDLDEEANIAIDELKEAVEQAISRLRHLMFELRPPVLDTEGLGAAVRAFIAKESGPSGLDLELNNRLAAEPDPALRAVLYRIAQEALHNVLKHADATRVSVTIEDSDGGISLRIEDDGRGFSNGEQAISPDHIGLAAIRERATMVGGWCRVDSTPGRGTTIRAWVPNPGGSATRGVPAPRP